MEALSRSSSDPGLSQNTSGKRRGGGSRAKLVDSTLLVAQSGARSLKGADSWEPFRFTHYQDGSVAFRAEGGGDQLLSKSSSASSLRGSRKRSVLPSSEVEVFLDADWRQPFLVAPLKPLQPEAELSQQLESSCKLKSQLGGVDMLYPFSLSYAPAEARLGGSESSCPPPRRTVMLAALDSHVRETWMASLQLKAKSPELRSYTVTPPVLCSASFAATASSSPQLSMPRRLFAGLGEKHEGLPQLGSVRTAKALIGKQRLPAGHAGLFESTSSLRIVQELYDGYAADPLGEIERGKRPVDETLSGQSADGRTQFLKRYVERQTEIERLIEQKWTGRPGPKAKVRETGAEAGARARKEAEDACSSAGNSRAGSAMQTKQVDRGILRRGVELAAKTPNVSFDGQTLENLEWSGGALFVPPNERSFRLTIRPENRLDSNPIFIGIAPADADLSIVNFFDVGGGIFLCMGGSPSDDLIAALGAPGGPALYAFGERDLVEMRVPPVGCTLTIHYTEEKVEGGRGEREGHVRFIVTDAGDNGAQCIKPKLKFRIPASRWRPCVLMSQPNTKVRVEQLI